MINYARPRTSFEGAAKINQAIPHVLGSGSVEAGTGSNSWAVAGSRTESGKAILSNDPHLATSIPSAFAQVGLHCRTVSEACPFDVSGFSMASMPGVVIGKNNKIAWGLTTSYVDVQDLYLEDVRGDTVREGDSVRAAARDHRGDPGPGRGPAADHSHPLLPARTAALRCGPAAATGLGQQI